ncbi:MAG: hypothetical protein HY362_02820 [Candidatus Aenigmarchaeota archaeon]|nr:hypothetical protein [Candidatus Aenigmarchaeota archaeon]
MPYVPVTGKTLVVNSVIYSEVFPFAHPSYYRVSLYQLKAHENIVDKHVREVAQQIRDAGRLNRPIPVSRWFCSDGAGIKYSDVVLDGHHRLAALNLLLGDGYNIDRVPVHVVEYTSDRVQLGLWPTAKIARVEKMDVVAAGLSGRLMEPKTTKHLFNPPLPEEPTPLEELRDPDRRVVPTNAGSC